MTLDLHRQLLTLGLSELHGTESLLLGELPLLIRKSHSARLANALAALRLQTEVQLLRLEACLNCGRNAVRPVPSLGMRGLIREMRTDARVAGHADVQDAALLGNGRRVVQWQLGMYANTRRVAHALDESAIVRWLDQGIAEEQRADVILTRIMAEEVGPAACRATTAFTATT